jgi:integrase
MGRKARVVLWSVTVGGYGHTVRACERRPGGTLHIRSWNSAKENHTWSSLGHRDKIRAEEQARELSGELLNATLAVRSPRITIIELLSRYERDVIAFKKPGHARDDGRRVALWQHLLGSREARTIDFPTLDRFVRERQAGRITVPGHRLREPDKKMKNGKIAQGPNGTTIGADIIFLQSVFNWALRVVLPDGSRLLNENPIRGYERPRNKNPKQPLATYDRFLKVRAKADDADPQGLFGSFLDLIEGLGWRVSAICNLRRTDIDKRQDDDAPHGRIRKRGEVDKEQVDMWVPLSESTRAAVDRILERNPVLGDLYLFPARKSRHVDRPAPWSRFYARDLLARAEKLGGLKAIEGGDFHPYRRAWATSRKNLPAQDVAQAGGWRDLRSLERSYQKADPKTVLRVMTEPAKVRDVGRSA